MCFAQESEEKEDEEWVSYQKGANFYYQKDYGEAFSYFRKAAAGRDYPEAEYWIGQIFENEGNIALALKQYEKALELSDVAENRGFHYTVLYRIAAIYERQKKYNLYELTLERIVNEIKRETNADLDYENVLTDRILDNGMDKLVYYFRHEGDSLVKPSSDLGIYYFSHSRDRNAVRYLLSATMIVLTRIMEQMKEYDPGWNYINFKQTVNQGESHPAIMEYMEESEFYKIVFFLALALDNIGEIKEGNYLISVLAEGKGDNNYKNMAARIKSNNYATSYKNGIMKAFLFPIDSAE